MHIHMDIHMHMHMHITIFRIYILTLREVSMCALNGDEEAAVVREMALLLCGRMWMRWGGEGRGSGVGEHGGVLLLLEACGDGAPKKEANALASEAQGMLKKKKKKRRRRSRYHTAASPRVSVSVSINNVVLCFLLIPPSPLNNVVLCFFMIPLLLMLLQAIGFQHPN